MKEHDSELGHEYGEFGVKFLNVDNASGWCLSFMILWLSLWMLRVDIEYGGK